MVRRPDSWIRLGLLACALALATAGGRLHGQSRAGESFAARIDRLSEPGGYFDTDNLISNERSYLHPIDALRESGVSGGVYIGVGPDQNFSYIAQIRPSMAFIIDVRRDNLLLHLLFKALFTVSRDRAEYLGLLFGRPPPPAGLRSGGDLRRTTVRELAEYVDGVSATAASAASALARADAALARFGVALTREDRDTIARFHRRFIAAGLSLRFQSTGRAPRSDYPTYRDLLLETDRGGRDGHYLASDDAFEFVKSLQLRDGITPVVGDLAGDRAMASIARDMADRNARLSAFYTSNVELYLAQDGLLPRFVANLARLPHDGRSVIIRTVFRTTTAESVPGYSSTSFVRPVAGLLDRHDRGRIRSYWDLIDQ